MQAIEIQDFARRLYDAHGPKAIAEAAQKARSCPSSENPIAQAETWRRIEATLLLIRGPNEK